MAWQRPSGSQYPTGEDRADALAKVMRIKYYREDPTEGEEIDINGWYQATLHCRDALSVLQKDFGSEEFLDARQAIENDMAIYRGSFAMHGAAQRNVKLAVTGSGYYCMVPLVFKLATK